MFAVFVHTTLPVRDVELKKVQGVFNVVCWMQDVNVLVAN
jgi:hypothetical protein